MERNSNDKGGYREWDKQGSCLTVKREEKEKYAKQTTRYTFVMNKEIRYY
ncbi:hypothetical protein [Siccibacter turicensis]|nr:hypothetical protein [Siccibacter turicensis]MDY0972526.1 hypothetical protein [Siccibacter turicensis]